MQPKHSDDGHFTKQFISTYPMHSHCLLNSTFLGTKMSKPPNFIFHKTRVQSPLTRLFILSLATHCGNASNRRQQRTGVISSIRTMPRVNVTASINTRRSICSGMYNYTWPHAGRVSNVDTLRNFRPGIPGWWNTWSVAAIPAGGKSFDVGARRACTIAKKNSTTPKFRANKPDCAMRGRRRDGVDGVDGAAAA